MISARNRRGGIAGRGAGVAPRPSTRRETLWTRSRVVKTGDVVLPMRMCSHSAVGRDADEVGSGCVSS